MLKRIISRLLCSIIVLSTVCTALGQGGLSIQQIEVLHGGSNQWTKVTVIRDGDVLLINSRDLAVESPPVPVLASDIIAFDDASDMLLDWKKDHPTEALPDGLIATLPKSSLFRADGTRMDRAESTRPLSKANHVSGDTKRNSLETQASAQTPDIAPHSLGEAQSTKAATFLKDDTSFKQKSKEGNADASTMPTRKWIITGLACLALAAAIVTIIRQRIRARH